MLYNLHLSRPLLNLLPATATACLLLLVLHFFLLVFLLRRRRRRRRLSSSPSSSLLPAPLHLGLCEDEALTAGYYLYVASASLSNVHFSHSLPLSYVLPLWRARSRSRWRPSWLCGCRFRFVAP